jgi:formic-like protein
LIKSLATAAGVAPTNIHHHHQQQQHHHHNTSSSSSSSKSSTPKNSGGGSSTSTSSSSTSSNSNGLNSFSNNKGHATTMMMASNDLNNQFQSFNLNNNNNNNRNSNTTSSNSSGYDTLSQSTTITSQHHHHNHDLYNNHNNNNNNYKMMSMLNNTSNNTLPHSSTNNGTIDVDNMFSNLSGDELNTLMSDAVTAMDLPPDKLKIVKMLPDDKKIQFLISLRYVSEKQPPEYYTKALNTYIEGMSNSKSTYRRPKLTPSETSTALIKNLEVSLRTNRIDWVHKFLDSPLNGLDVLIGYLENSLNLMREYEQFNLDFIDSTTTTTSSVVPNYSNYQSQNNSPLSTYGGLVNGSVSTLLLNNKNQSLSAAASLERRASRAHKDTRKRMLKLNMGEAIDDVHECVRCLRAIMNHQYGFHMIIGHKEAINSIALSLKHREYRTKSLVLELLAAVCLVDGGHSIVLRAFDNFKDVYKEMYRFETLMNYFRKDSNEPDFNIDFMVACMQFINIIVHSTQHMNFRVHLQYEFTQLGLDEYLENKLRYNESDRLQVQIQAYLDNQFDVQQLLEDADAKNETMLELEKIRDELSIEKERFNKAQDDALNKISELQNELCQVRAHLDIVAKEKEAIFIQMDTLKRNSHIQQQQQQQQQYAFKINDHLASITPVPPPAPPPPPPPLFMGNGPDHIRLNGPAPPPPPPPPPLPMMMSGNRMATNGGPPPPPPGMAEPPIPTMTIKKKIETKYRLPNLNWIALKPQQVKGTVFCELDDEKLLKVIDFDTFEEMFKTGPGQNISNNNNNNSNSNNIYLKSDSPSTLKKMPKKTNAETLLEAQRQRNLAISRRKIEMGMNELVKAINK